MEKLHRYFQVNDDRREVYGAVAAAFFPAEALEFALGQGLYAICYAGEDIEVREPEGGVKAW
jgi:hypothetical protein